VDGATRGQPVARDEAFVIRSATTADASAIGAIYNHYVETSIATFEESAVSADEMARRIHAGNASWPWLVAEQDGAVVGYACANPWKPRSAYRYAVESSVYLDATLHRRGLGTALYATLIRMLEAQGAHCINAGIALPNLPSVALHEKFGFTKVAHFRENGFKLGRWIDVGYWQRVF
jgi:L-amino acid N-acyltransferase YncA